MSDVDLCIATALGPGAGRFLAASLSDVLGSGATLAAIVDSGKPPSEGNHGVEFVFDDGTGEEVIRVGLDTSDEVVCVEIVRRPRRIEHARPCETSALVEALARGSEVHRLRLSPGEPPSLSLTMRSDLDVSIEVDDSRT